MKMCEWCEDMQTVIFELQQKIQAQEHELEEADKIIKGLRSGHGRLVGKKSPKAPMLGAPAEPLRTVRAVRTEITAEEIFHRIEAEAATFAMHRDPECKFDIFAALECAPNLPFTDIVGFNPGFKRSARALAQHLECAETMSANG